MNILVTIATANIKLKKKMENLTNKKKKVFVTESGDALKDLEARYKYLTPFVEDTANALMIGYAQADQETPTDDLLFNSLKDNINAVSGVGGNYYLSYPDIRISRGELAAPKILGLKYLSKKRVMINWENLPQTYAANERMVYLLQYNATLRESFIWYHNHEVDDDSAEILSPAVHYGDEIHYWLFFTDMDGKQKSNSVYAGQIRPLSN